MRHLQFRQGIAAALLVAVVGAGCVGGTTSAPAASAAPSPTPIAVHVTSPELAAGLVMATDPRFAGMRRLDSNMIGASAWWESAPRNGGGYVITVTIGWGDCPAGCISRHVWTFDVTGQGAVTMTGESGEPLPSGPLQT